MLYICLVKPIILFVMKKQTSKPLDELIVDVLEYMFVEWLVRRSLYSRFSENLVRAWPNSGNPRSIIRNLIRLNRPVNSLADLIPGCFPFGSTPEGFRFWISVSDEWSRYFKSFFETI